MSFLAGQTWLDAPPGSFLRIPAGVTHDFENRSAGRAGVLNVFLPGGFEVMMPAIVDYFAEQGDADKSETQRPERSLVATISHGIGDSGGPRDCD